MSDKRIGYGVYWRTESWKPGVYIKLVRMNPLAAKIKMADLTHNIDLTRFGNRLLALWQNDLYNKLFLGTTGVINPQKLRARSSDG